jgi:hypothetical protein
MPRPTRSHRGCGRVSSSSRDFLRTTTYSLLFYYGTYDTLSMVPYTLSEFRDPCCPRAKSGFRRKYYF